MNPIGDNPEFPPTQNVRVRSNVCVDPDAIHLVPLGLARTHWPDRSPTAKQKEEMAYLQLCTLCKRRLFEIHEFGCDHHVCKKSGVPSVDESMRLRARRRGEEPLDG